MTDVRTRSLVSAALFAALTFIATYMIRIPTPGTGGYIHPGDAFVILSGVFLGPVYGFCAAGIGSALADILGGYFFYAPVTFLIKGIIGLISGLIFKNNALKIKTDRAKLILSGLFASLFVALGYFAFEVFVYGPGAAASIPANLIQGLSGLIISNLLFPVLRPLTKQKPS